MKNNKAGTTKGKTLKPLSKIPNFPKMKQLKKITDKLEAFCKKNKVVVFAVATMKDEKKKEHSLILVDGYVSEVAHSIKEGVMMHPSLYIATIRELIGENAVIQFQTKKS